MKHVLKMEVFFFLFYTSVLGALTLVTADDNDGIDSELILPYTRVLDQESGYILKWKVDRKEKTIQFDITTRVTDGVSTVFGLTRKGHLEGGDVVIFGVNSDGSSYIHDMHGIDNKTLIYDTNQNWKIVGTKLSSSGEAEISIKRNLDTCDAEDDLVINSDLIRVVWGSLSTELLGNKRKSKSSTETISFAPESNLPIYFMDKELPPLTPSTSPLIQTLRLSRDLQLPARPTAYWCSIHKGPQLSRKNHIVGFGSYFRNNQSRSHVHHQVVYRCTAPPGQDADSLFGQFSKQPGQECYLPVNGKQSTLPIPFCRESVFAWGLGGYDTQLPENVGIPLESNEYFLFETHYSNPESRGDLFVENGVDFQITPRLRQNDGGMFFIAYGVITPELTNEYIFAVPPKSTDFTVAGQCSPKCVREMLPASGVEISAVLLHAHHAVKMHVRHFRGDKELPEIQSDDNYDHHFAQWRLLNSPTTILPGDHLTVECSYNLSEKNGTLVGGHSATDEMCNAFILTNKRVPYLYCSSEFPARKLFSKFGVEGVAWDTHAFERVVASSFHTPSDVGRPFSKVVDSFTHDWTPAQRKQLQEEMMFSEHIAVCPPLSNFAKVATTRPHKIQKLFPLSSVEYPKSALLSAEKSSQDLKCNKKSSLPLSSPGGQNYNHDDYGKQSEKTGWLKHIPDHSFNDDHHDLHSLSSPPQSFHRRWSS